MASPVVLITLISIASSPTACAAASRQHEQHGEIGRAFGQCVRCVRDDDSPLASGSHVHVVKARARVRNDLDRRGQRGNVLGLQTRLLPD